MKTARTKAEAGTILIQTLVFATIAAFLMSALTVGVGTSLKASRRAVYREQAIQIAEAGIEYYRWHLAHDQDDYEDGTEGPGPYVHEFVDTQGDRIGEFELEIDPPPSGSTIVTVTSTGRVDAEPDMERTVEVRLAIPSFAKYAVVANDQMRFGEGTEVFGAIHANQGIRFDGITHNIITSAQSSYDDPDHDEFGADDLEFGVHTHVSPVDPLPPAGVPSRTDVFEAGRDFPVPTVDFIGVTSDLSEIKAEATANGFALSDSGRLGYEMVLKTNDTLDLYRVTSVYGPPNNCYVSSQPGWGTWSINRRSFMGTYAFPENGLIFVDDNLWVRGEIDTARLTIAAAHFPVSPGTYKSITINDDLTYTNHDGQDVIALISQYNINIGLYSANEIEIEGALIAQNGRVGRYYYGSHCGSYSNREVVALNGMIGTNSRYGFAYTDGTGYETRILDYDANLLYGPPPSFPLTSDQYEIISWREVK